MNAARIRDFDFARFGPTVRKPMVLVPGMLNQQAIFDTLEHLAHTYVRDKLVLLGDAAHASPPHYGAGAVCGVEDATAISTLLAAAIRNIQAGNRQDKTASLHAASEVYDTIRRERASWMVESSRFVGELYEWQTYAGRQDMGLWCGCNDPDGARRVRC